MPKKACCCKTCCAPYNYTNNVAMLGDLLVDSEFNTNPDTGEIIIDPVTGEPEVIVKSVDVYPIHPDDELILFQNAGPHVAFGGGNQSDQLRSNGCKCCYGQSNFRPIRTQTIRQKYKNIGCAWTWYPAKYAIDGNPTIPQCNSSGFFNSDTNELTRASDCFFQRLYGFSQGDPEDTAFSKCDSCTQIFPFTTQVKEKNDFGQPNFDIWGDTFPDSNLNLPNIGRARFIENGWLTQYASFYYPGHRTDMGNSCCSCWQEPLENPGQLTTPDVSCWNKGSNPLSNFSQCAALSDYRGLREGIHPLRTPKTSTGNIFYSPLQGRSNSIKNPSIINLDNAFEMGKNTEFGSAYFINEELISSLYIPSSGGYNQNSCNYCASSPYLRNLMKVSYPWAFDIFCAGDGDLSSPAKTYDIGSHYVRTDIGDFGLLEDEGLHVENIGSNFSEPNIRFFMEQYKEMMGESTFYSQFIGIVHLEHYFHYMGTNMVDVEAAGDTIPPGVGFSGNDDGRSQSPKDRWGYWLTRTTPKIFTFKSSGTPLFHFDLVYADRMGIFQSFADPDRRENEKMTIEKFLSYFSMYSNSVMGQPLPDLRGQGMYPPGCGDGHPYVQIVRDILGAMCEAGIIGTRDHRENIYNEIKQIIETGIANGRNGAYYKPWAPGNSIPVTPGDFDKLYNKYFAPNKRMCTPAEMFPENGLEGLAKFSPIRKVIPPSLLSWEGWQADEDIPTGQVFMYKEHPVDPDDIFNEGTASLVKCTGGSTDPVIPKYKIQNLQFSKYYNNGAYSEDSPGYVNRQLFFRAIPGAWRFVKWGSLCLFAADCSECIGPTPCSPYNLYGDGPNQTFNPENLWHSDLVTAVYYPRTLPNGGDDPRHNGILSLCNGIPADGQGVDECPFDGISRGEGINTEEGCGSGGICWDASGAPSKTICIPDCSLEDDSPCKRTTPPCGRECQATFGCSNQIQSFINNSNNVLNFQSFVPKSQGLCKDLYGSECCACIGKAPDDIITDTEWSNILFGKEKKCQECSTKCLVGCPEKDIPINDTSIDNSYKLKNGRTASSGAPDQQNIIDICLPCDTQPACSELGRSACDTNCGYNGWEYHPLCVVMTASTYAWSRDHIIDVSAPGEPPQEETCSLCSCSGSNTCWARFGGKVQKYNENETTHFYSPQEDPEGNLYYTDNDITLPFPTHALTVGSQVSKLAAMKLHCNECESESGPDNFELCACDVLGNDGWGSLCPGALFADFIFANSDCTKFTDFWCRYRKSGTVIVKKIKTGDIVGPYEY